MFAKQKKYLNIWSIFRLLSSPTKAKHLAMNRNIRKGKIFLSKPILKPDLQAGSLIKMVFLLIPEANQTSITAEGNYLHVLYIMLWTLKCIL